MTGVQTCALPIFEKNVDFIQQLIQDNDLDERGYFMDMGSVYRTRGAHAIHCLTVIGQVEGHVEAPKAPKT